jgi:hypothetical protein
MFICKQTYSYVEPCQRCIKIIVGCWQPGTQSVDFSTPCIIRRSAPSIPLTPLPPQRLKTTGRLPILIPPPIPPPSSCIPKPGRKSPNAVFLATKFHPMHQPVPVRQPQRQAVRSHGPNCLRCISAPSVGEECINSLVSDTPPPH